MNKSFKQALRTSSALVIAFSALTIAAGNAIAAGERLASLSTGQPSERIVYATVGEPSRAPIGWVEFCIEYKSECTTRPSAPRDIVLTSKTWDDLVKVNNWVNDSIKPITDVDHWGTVERWNYPDDGYGDCEDYVLLKRKMLIQAGWPREALLITVVRDKKGEGHAVLTVKTNRGEFILDNQESEVLAWNKTGYKFVKRQSQTDQNVWVALGEPRGAPATVSAR
ncbi:MAG: transglutaminase-like cysteine peptidase [Pseudolabrys sp.]|nr:transglutaminase-like cysteine peptidase [Pseudolabrys sp.]MDP2294907.1 transglutaminase-like cysteine peptidase [Pseudolabrys sp.]